MERFLYVGLGNAGERFSGTRHNLGIEALRAWVAKIAAEPGTEVSDWHERPEYPGLEASVIQQGWRVHCLFPTTMMNESGQAVAASAKKVPVPLEGIVVIHDDVELPLGEVQLVRGGSAKGHNGVRSIQQALGTSNFWRVRLGVGRPPAGVSLADFVLQKLLPQEHEAEQEMIRAAGGILSELTSGEATERPFRE